MEQCCKELNLGAKRFWVLFALSAVIVVANNFNLTPVDARDLLSGIAAGINLALLAEFIPLGRHNWRVVRAGRGGVE